MPLGRGFAEIIAESRGMQEDLAWLKRIAKEQSYRRRAAAIFGRILRQGYEATNQVADLLQEAQRTLAISDREYEDTLAADLL